MKCSVTLMIQKKIDLSDPDDPEEMEDVVRGLEAEGWSVSIESVEPDEEEDSGRDEDEKSLEEDDED